MKKQKWARIVILPLVCAVAFEIVGAAVPPPAAASPDESATAAAPDELATDASAAGLPPCTPGRNGVRVLEGVVWQTPAIPVVWNGPAFVSIRMPPVIGCFHKRRATWRWVQTAGDSWCSRAAPGGVIITDLGEPVIEISPSGGRGALVTVRVWCLAEIAWGAVVSNRWFYAERVLSHTRLGSGEVVTNISPVRVGVCDADRSVCAQTG